MSSKAEQNEFLEKLLSETLGILGYPGIDDLMEAYDAQEEEDEGESD